MQVGDGVLGLKGRKDTGVGNTVRAGFVGYLEVHFK